VRCTWKNWRGANVVLVRNFLFTLDNQIVLFHLWSAGRNFPCDILEGCLIFMNTYLLISVQYPSHSWKVGIRTLPLLHLVMCICLRSCAWHALAKSICGCLEHPQTNRIHNTNEYIYKHSHIHTLTLPCPWERHDDVSSDEPC